MNRYLLTSLICFGLLLVCVGAVAQPGRVISSGEAVIKAAGEGASPSGGPAQPDKKPGDSDGKENDQDKKKDDNGKDDKSGKDKKGADTKKDGEKGSETVERPDKPGFTVDPSELNVQPVDGKVEFNFQGQPWEGVLQWLAAISGMSLDWQELPGDFLNLRTQRPYSIAETRDLINQHLLARGYTLLRHGDVLRVVKLSKLDPALVPHIDPAELDERDKHEFVQTIFELDWIPAAKAEEELKPMLSPNGKLTKLTTTNRLHAMDAVVNLIAIRDLLDEEQSGRGEARLVQSFKLKYARAEDVKKSLEELLGLDQSGGGGDSMSSDQRRMMQQMQQRMQQMQQQQKKNGAAAPTEEEKASIIANPRENAIIATAPPETMQIIEKTVDLLDSPTAASSSLDARLRRMHVYRLAELDPETLADMLLELGGLDPTTKITPDEDNNSIIVNGSVADHLVVKQVIEKLDGSQRSPKVIRLRRLPADYVAGTIQFIMVGEEEENSRSRYGWWYDDDDDEQKSTTGEFKVDADVANNRLILYANPIELEQVNDLLVQLGEIRPTDAARSNVRVLDLTEEQAAVFLERLENQWQGGKSHPLVIDPDLKKTTADEDAEKEDARNEDSQSEDAENDEERIRDEIRQGDPFTPAPAGTGETGTSPATSDGAGSVAKTTLVAERPAAHMMLQDSVPEADAETPATGSPIDAGDASLPGQVEELFSPSPNGVNSEEATDPFTPGEPAPVTIRRGPDGGLIVHSKDTEALNVVEDLMYELAPKPKDYHIFHLKYPTTYSLYVAWNLEDFFGIGTEDEDDNGYSPFFYYSRYDRDDSDESPMRLSQRRELKFIPDEDSRTILVQGATPEQLETIEELIEIYDQPPTNSGDLRVMKIFYLQHSQAEDVAEAVKDVYRDLLSANDPALQRGRGGREDRERPVAERSYTYVMGGGDGRDQPEAPIKFKGLLSIAIGEESNTLVVSASQNLIDEISRLIESLDGAAQQKESVSVVNTGSGGVPENLSTQLKNIFGSKITIVGETATDASKTISQNADDEDLASDDLSDGNSGTLVPASTLKQKVISPVGPQTSIRP